MKTHALTIKQPWASLIAHGLKDIENRTWHTSRRGLIYIHASAKLDNEECRSATELMSTFDADSMVRLRSSPIRHVDFRDYPRGAIIGVAVIVDCVTTSDSPWFVGPYGFVLKNARMFKTPIECKGALQFWSPIDKMDPEQLALLASEKEAA